MSDQQYNEGYANGLEVGYSIGYSIGSSSVKARELGDLARGRLRLVWSQPAAACARSRRRPPHLAVV